jgi:hypothetical protein
MLEFLCGPFRAGERGALTQGRPAPLGRGLPWALLCHLFEVKTRETYSLHRQSLPRTARTARASGTVWTVWAQIAASLGDSFLLRKCRILERKSAIFALSIAISPPKAVWDSQ